MDRAQCLARLAGIHLGSVALTVDALPVVLPIAVGRLGEDLLVRAGAHGVLVRSMPGRVVSVLVTGDVDAHLRAGWTVAVTAVAELVTQPEEVAACLRVPLRGWSANDLFIRVPPTIVVGRDLGPFSTAGADGSRTFAPVTDRVRTPRSDMPSDRDRSLTDRRTPGEAQNS
jgi:hypothetical protein